MTGDQLPSPLPAEADTKLKKGKSASSERRKLEVLKTLQKLARWLPVSVRQPVLWIAATLLIAEIIFPIVVRVVPQAQGVANIAVKNTTGSILLGGILGLVLLTGLIERLLKSIAAAEDHKAYKKQLERVTVEARPDPEEKQDADDRLNKDSYIVGHIQTYDTKSSSANQFIVPESSRRQRALNEPVELFTRLASRLWSESHRGI